MMRQHLAQKQLQKLSPQQIQLMKLLQVPTALLEQRIQEELEINPALEDGSQDDETDYEEYEYGDESPQEYEAEDNSAEVDDFSTEEETYEDAYEHKEVELDQYLEDYANDDDTASYKLEVNNYGPDQEEKTIPLSVESSFYESLEQQLGLLDLSSDELLIAKQIIGTIDEDGYLRRELSAIVDDLAFGQNLFTTEEKVLEILLQIQRFEPAGVGARNLQECLQLQLERKLYSDEVKQHYSKEELRYLKLALQIITDYFDEFSKKHYSKLLRSLNLYEDDLKEITKEILHLNPKPGSAFLGGSNTKQQYIIPDFIVENRNGELELILNSRNAPELRISDHYREMLQTYSQGNKKDRKQKEAIAFVKQKIDSARWFIDAIKQRQDTMTRTMEAILQHQKDFFLTGDEKKIRPMILKDVADITGLDISTVSRVANSKYVQTEFGTKRLKDFFSESMQTESGEEVSTLEVKKILEDVVKAEDKRKPHSD
jgi:RNA polymerase sigma-54 factor